MRLQIQDFNYNIIDNIVKRKMERLQQIDESIKIDYFKKNHSIKKLMKLNEEVEELSSILMPYFEAQNLKTRRK